MKNTKPQPITLANQDTNLNQLAADGKAIHKRIQKKAADLVYEVVDFGLRLLKAKDIHQCDTVSRRLPNGQLGESDDGYHKWIEDHFPRLEIRTAQRYVNAALNAGLTPGSPLTAVRAMRKERALHQKQLTDLYRAPKLIADAAPKPVEAEEEKPNLVRDTLRALGQECENAINLRDQMDGQEYDACVTRLQETLERLTGCKWDMIEADGKIAREEIHGR